MATVMGAIQTCNTPVTSRIDDGGWLVVTRECGCSVTYGRYYGIGCRNVVSTTVCALRVCTCAGCGRQTYPHNDCVCELEGEQP